VRGKVDISNWSEEEQRLYLARNRICNVHDNRTELWPSLSYESIDQVEQWMQKQGMANKRRFDNEN